ncbi:MAG: hypothetical protein ACYDBV_11220 [Nitrospiria bacterium]
MSQILLTTQQIFEIANFAGLQVSEPDDDEKDVEFMLDSDMRIVVETEEGERDFTYKGLGIYDNEYPEEGALPLDNLNKSWSC